MAKKYQYQLGPSYISTEHTFQRGVNPMQVEAWIRSQSFAYMENGDNTGSKALADLLAKFREAWKADFKALTERDGSDAE